MPRKLPDPPDPLDPDNLAATKLRLIGVARDAGVPEEGLEKALEAGLEALRLRRDRPTGDAGMLEWMAKMRTLGATHRGLPPSEKVPPVEWMDVTKGLFADAADPRLAPLVDRGRARLPRILVCLAAHLRDGRVVEELIGTVVATGPHFADPSAMVVARKAVPNLVGQIRRPGEPLPPEHLEVVVTGDDAVLARRMCIFRLFPEREIGQTPGEPRRPRSKATSAGPIPIPEEEDERYATAWFLHAGIHLAHRQRLLANLFTVVRAQAAEGIRLTVRHLVGTICVTEGQGTTLDSGIALRETALRLVRPQRELTARLKNPPKGAGCFQVLVWAGGYKSLVTLDVKFPEDAVASPKGYATFDELDGWA